MQTREKTHIRMEWEARGKKLWQRRAWEQWGNEMINMSEDQRE